MLRSQVTEGGVNSTTTQPFFSAFQAEAGREVTTYLCLRRLPGGCWDNKEVAHEWVGAEILSTEAQRAALKCSWEGNFF